jgi:pimeloyl-ACP methyl ester carboxylesterase
MREWTPGRGALPTMQETQVNPAYDIELAVGPYTFPARSAGPANGKLVLLLHGFPESSWEWHNQIDALAAAGYRAVAPEQRGYSPGARPENIEDYAIELLVADVIGMADALGASTFHLVGHDWGAIVAWHVAASHPERLESLTIVSVPHPTAWAAAFADPSSDQPQRSAYLPEMKRVGSEENMGEEFLRFAFDNSGLAGFDTGPHIAVLGNGEAMRAALNWYRAYDFTTMGLPDITVPTLFVWSPEDVAIAREGAELTGNHVDAPYRFEVIEQIGHWIPELAAAEFSAMLLEHLTAQSGRPAAQ